MVKKKKINIKKPTWTEITIIILLAYTALYLYFDHLPNVVSTEMSCPKEINYGKYIEIALKNYGGSSTSYDISLISSGIKCFTSSHPSSFSGSIIQDWNKEHNETNCFVNYFIGVGSTERPGFTIFISDEYPRPEYANFKISYTYNTYILLPFIIMKTNERELLQCNYIYDGYERYILDNSN